MKDNTLPLQPDFTYHIYNRANGNEKLFIVFENYKFFLDKFAKHIFPIAETFCYCLMPNHFHFLIRIRSEKEILELIMANTSLLKPDSTLLKSETLVKLDEQTIIENYLSKQFSNLFSSYTQSFNKQQNRKGNLFMHTFKRKKIENSNYLMKVVRYIHLNPVQANLCEFAKDYQHSSYKSLISKSVTLLNRDETISWFGDLENFIYMHRVSPDSEDIEFDN